MYPILFQLGSFKINSYILFNGLALLAGALLYFQLSKTQKTLRLEERMLLWAGGLAGGFIGAKFFDIILNFKIIMANLSPYLTQQSGTRTILGGIIGGYFGVKAAKKYLGITEKTGDPFALAALAAMGIGRIGCLLGGCCFGKPYHSWFSIYLHGEYRYPTQIIEMVFDFGLLAILLQLRCSMKKPGDLFKLFVFSYATFRFLIEFIRTEPVIWHGLTLYQLMALPLIVLTGLYFYRNYYKAGFRHGKLD